MGRNRKFFRHGARVQPKWLQNSGVAMKKVFSVVFVICAAVSLPGLAHGATLNRECRPAGMINTAKAIASPRSFWAGAIDGIEKERQGALAAFQLSTIERRNDKIRESLRRQEYAAAGVPLANDPSLDYEMAALDRDAAKLDFEMLNITLEWAGRCRAYAQQRLQEASAK